MKFSRAFGMVDLVVAIMMVVAIMLPARVMYADSALKGVDQEHRFALALEEAHTIAHPDDGGATANLARLLGAANFRDWAIEAAVHGSDRAKGSPSRWRALFAVAGAYVERREAEPAIDYAHQAMAACELAGPVECPSWESLPLELFVTHLEVGDEALRPAHAGAVPKQPATP